jgi:hypothetical protein
MRMEGMDADTLGYVQQTAVGTLLDFPFSARRAAGLCG